MCIQQRAYTSLPRLPDESLHSRHVRARRKVCGLGEPIWHNTGKQCLDREKAKKANVRTCTVPTVTRILDCPLVVRLFSRYRNHALYLEPTHATLQQDIHYRKSRKSQEITINSRAKVPVFTTLNVLLTSMPSASMHTALPGSEKDLLNLAAQPASVLYSIRLYVTIRHRATFPVC